MVAALKAHAHVFIAASSRCRKSMHLGTWCSTTVPAWKTQIFGAKTTFCFSDVAQFPKTTVADNCGSVIRTDGDLVLCNARKDVPLGYIPVPPPAGKMSVIDLADRSWTVTSAFRLRWPPARVERL